MQAQSIPTVTLFVRHSATCNKKDAGEFYQKCNCRKHLRWSQGGKQFRQTAGTRSWTQAETVKRNKEDELSGRTPTTPNEGHSLASAVETFLQSKKQKGITDHSYNMYKRDLERLQAFSEKTGAFTVAVALTPERLIAFRDTWPSFAKSSYTRMVMQKRIRHFLQFCYTQGSLTKIPHLEVIKVDSPETQPLTEQEYNAILEAVPKVFKGDKATKIHALIQLMRHSGLAVRDASCLKRSDLSFDESKGLYRIIRTRTKTGTHIYVPLPPDVAKELLTVLNGNETYVFWNHQGGSEGRQARHAGEDIAEVFKAAGVHCAGHMVSHRLRDSYAVALLVQGVPLETVSTLLGHTSVITTQKHYAQWVKGRQDHLDALVTATWAK